jgi:multidrug efflux system membrane fusion protein
MEPLALITARSRKALRYVAFGLLAAALLGSLLPLAGCSSQTAESEGMRRMEFRVPVDVTKAEQKTVPVQVEAIGNVEAYSTVSVRTQVAGEIQKVYFTQGQDVKKGQLLLTIDPRPFETQLNQLEADLARDQAQLENAQLQTERSSKLLRAGIISQEQYDTTRTTSDALKATVQADKAAIATAKINLSYCSIYSPLDGRTGALQVYPGNIAKVNDTIVVVINQIHPIYVTFAVPEQYLGDVRKYRARGPLAVEAAIPNDSRPPAHGVLTFIDNSVDQATGTIKMRGTFQNPDNRLWPGQFVNVVMKLTTLPHATVVPSQAVQTGMTGKYVYVVKPDMTADYREVLAGETVNGQTVIEKGVTPGETVVTDGQLQLAPGSKVEIKKGT